MGDMTVRVGLGYLGSAHISPLRQHFAPRRKKTSRLVSRTPQGQPFLYSNGEGQQRHAGEHQHDTLRQWSHHSPKFNDRKLHVIFSSLAYSNTKRIGTSRMT